MYKITEELRLVLKEPLGELVGTETLVSKAKAAKIVCAVGDECIYMLLANGVEPKICVFDNMTKRKPVEKQKKDLILKFCKNAKKIENPAGWISRELEIAVKNACSYGSGCIEVVGEEDLATIPAMLYSKEGFLVVYGQPEKGAVIIEGGRGAQEKASKIIAQFERI